MISSFELRQHSALFCGAFLAVALSLLPVSATAQGDLSVPAEALDPVSSACTSADDCKTAIDALIADLAEANPGVPIGEIIGAAASSLGAAYNEGIVSGAVAQVALQALAAIAEANGLAQLASSIRGAVSSVVAGDPIDVEAVAEGSASPS